MARNLLGIVQSPENIPAMTTEELAYALLEDMQARPSRLRCEEAASLTATTGNAHICAGRDGKTALTERRNIK